MRDSAPAYNEYARYKTAETIKDVETRIPVIEERLQVSKRVSTHDVTITKEPTKETKTVEVPVMHEELTIERRRGAELPQKSRCRARRRSRCP
jgi:stress response protein YsnF